MKKQRMVFLAMLLSVVFQLAGLRAEAGDIACYIGLETDNTVDVSNLDPYVGDDIADYSGVYAFGMDRSESYLLIVALEDRLVIQLKSKQFKGSYGAWDWTYTTVEPVSVEKNRITTPGWKAEFAVYTVYSKETIYQSDLVSKPYPRMQISGLLIFDCPLGISNEFGVKSEDSLERCPMSSVNVLTESDIRGKTSEELQIMRNEIFARYGFIFTPGGKMDTYFRTKPWYSPKYKEVYPMLTEIEKANIAFLKSQE